MDKIIEIVPNDLPKWAQKAFEEGQLFNKLESLVHEQRGLAIGWAYADCCADLDAGKDPRKTDMADVLKRADIDLDRPT